MNKEIQLSVHLGAHKTATTHLQRSIDEYEKATGGAGVKCYGPQYLRADSRPIQNLFGLKPWCGDFKPKRTPEKQLQFLAQGCQRVFISDENFLGSLHHGDGHLVLPLYPDASDRLIALAKALPGVRIRLFLAIRCPDTFIESAYSQTLLSGHFLSPADFKAKHQVHCVDWVPLVRGLANLPGIESLMVWQYEDYPKIFSYLVRRMLRWKLGTVIKPLKGNLHAGLSEEAVQRIFEWRDLGYEGPLANLAREDFPINETRSRFTIFDSEEKKQAKAVYCDQIKQISGIERCELVSMDELPNDLK